MADYSKHLAPKNITELYIDNLVTNSKGEPVPVTLHRYVPYKKGETIRRKVASRKPVENPVEVALSVENILGCGRCGMAFSTSIKSIRKLDDPDAHSIECSGPPYLPPVVVKVANGISEQKLVREAFNYTKFWELQGIDIPWCYGLFCIKLASNGLTYPGLYDYPEMDESNPERCILSVLLLERMGDHLTLEENEEEIEEIRDMLRDIAWKGMEHNDICYENLCQAPSSPGLPGGFCPGHGRRHMYRLIDLDSVMFDDTNNIDSMALRMYSFEHALRDIYWPRKIATIT